MRVTAVLWKYVSPYLNRMNEAVEGCGFSGRERSPFRRHGNYKKCFKKSFHFKEEIVFFFEKKLPKVAFKFRVSMIFDDWTSGVLFLREGEAYV